LARRKANAKGLRFFYKQADPWPAYDTRRGEEFSERAQIFWTVSNSFKLCPTHLSRGGEKFSMGASPPWEP